MEEHINHTIEARLMPTFRTIEQNISHEVRKLHAYAKDPSKYIPHQPKRYSRPETEKLSHVEKELMHLQDRIYLVAVAYYQNRTRLNKPLHDRVLQDYFSLNDLIEKAREKIENAYKRTHTQRGKRLTSSARDHPADERPQAIE